MNLNNSVTLYILCVKSIYELKKKLIATSKFMDPLTPLTLIYDSLILPIMCKGMYRKSSRKIARVNTALNDKLISSWNDDLINYACLANTNARLYTNLLHVSLTATRITWTF